MCVMCEAPLRARLIALATATYVDMNTHMRVAHRVAHAQHAHAPPVALPKVGRVKGRVHARAFGLPRVGLHALGDEAHVRHMVMLRTVRSDGGCDSRRCACAETAECPRSSERIHLWTFARVMSVKSEEYRRLHYNVGNELYGILMSPCSCLCMSVHVRYCYTRGTLAAHDIGGRYR